MNAHKNVEAMLVSLTSNEAADVVGGFFTIFGIDPEVERLSQDLDRQIKEVQAQRIAKGQLEPLNGCHW